MLHYLDDLDSKMAAMRAALSAKTGEGEWTAWNPALERRLLRLEEFWRNEAAADFALEPPPGPKKHGASGTD